MVNNRISSQMIDMNTGEIIPPIQKIEPKITHGIDDGQDMQNHGKDKKWFIIYLYYIILYLYIFNN